MFGQQRGVAHVQMKLTERGGTDMFWREQGIRTPEAKSIKAVAPKK